MLRIGERRFLGLGEYLSHIYEVVYGSVIKWIFHPFFHLALKFVLLLSCIFLHVLGYMCFDLGLVYIEYFDLGLVCVDYFDLGLEYIGYFDMFRVKIC